MSQSLSKICTHIVFSTKYRLPLINEKIEEELWNYLGGVCNELECVCIKVGGYVDHIFTSCAYCPKRFRQ
ncbi:transposase [Dyadobacter psychrotolerans]|uniref:transposase n=1 Tax=Dyadobacter psychrotolerans TaxID=2541721 RepID=UPI001C7100AA|nr:transposase [Dyadobacter psychrotolerans]